MGVNREIEWESIEKLDGIYGGWDQGILIEKGSGWVL